MPSDTATPRGAVIPFALADSVSLLTELGGHLCGCTDKLNGAEMFYANTAIKLASIAYRGAWAAFGVEFNFPVSHNWMTTSPVDVAFATDLDGSGSDRSRSSSAARSRPAGRPRGRGVGVDWPGAGRNAFDATAAGSAYLPHRCRGRRPPEQRPKRRNARWVSWTS